ncbi:hypothetical protein [Aureibaculum luteum]|nr:hypothetical protein [Aureibaculum luteum]
MMTITLFSKIALISQAEAAGENVGQYLWYVILVVAIYFIVRRIRKKK